MDKRKELALCGPVKTVMMLLIVLYHAMANWMEGGWFPAAPAVPCAAIGLVASWLNTVHVPVFVFVSGYLYAYLKRETDRYADTRAVLAKKARRLLVPYAFVSTVWAAPFYAIFYGAGPAQLLRKFALGGGRLLSSGSCLRSSGSLPCSSCLPRRRPLCLSGRLP